MFKNIYFVESETLAIQANEPLKHNNAKKLGSINLNFILYYVFALSICEDLQYHWQQYYYNQQKNGIHIHLIRVFLHYKVWNLLKYYLKTVLCFYIYFFALNWYIFTLLTYKKLDDRKCNSNQKWNNDKCHCVCKNDHIWKKIISGILLYVVVKIVNI